jgi:Transposase DDE domain group 1
MPTECSPTLFEFAPVAGRAVVAAFDGGAITSDAGGLLLGATDRAISLVDRFAACFTDHRCADLIEHEVSTLVGQRVFGIALGYEDLNDHDQLHHDPMIEVDPVSWTPDRLRSRSPRWPRQDCPMHLSSAAKW